MDNILVITSCLTNEISLSAVANFIRCKFKTFTIEELNQLTLSSLIEFINNFKLNENKINKVILIGSYWSMMIKHLNIISNVEIIVLNSTKTIHENLIKLTNFLHTEELLQNNKKLFELLDAKYNCDNDKILETEPLYAGLSNYKDLSVLTAIFQSMIYYQKRLVLKIL